MELREFPNLVKPEFKLAKWGIQAHKQKYVLLSGNSTFSVNLVSEFLNDEFNFIVHSLPFCEIINVGLIAPADLRVTNPTP